MRDKCLTDIDKCSHREWLLSWHLESRIYNRRRRGGACTTLRARRLEVLVRLEALNAAYRRRASALTDPYGPAEPCQAV